MGRMNANVNVVNRMGGNQLPPDASELAHWFNKRDDLTLVDSKGDSNASITGNKALRFDTAKSVSIPEIVIADGGCLELYITPEEIGQSYRRITSCYKAGPTRVSGLIMWDNTNTIGVYFLKTDGTGFLGTQCAFPTDFIADLRVKLTLRISGSSFSLQRSDTDDIIDVDLGEPIQFVIDRIGTYDPVSTQNFIGIIEGLKVNGQLVYGLNGHAVNSVDGVEAASSADSLISLSSNALMGLQNKFFTLSSNEQVLKPLFQLPLNAIEHPANKFHNLVESYIDFGANPEFNRYDVDRFEQAARDSVHANGTYPGRWHVDELRYSTFNAYRKAGYKEMIFLHLDSYANPTYSNGILVYQSSRVDSSKALSFINYNI